MAARRRRARARRARRGVRTGAQLVYRPAIEELSYWRPLAHGRWDAAATATAHTPFGLAAGGAHDLAADRWRAIGCPYEEAMARYLTGAVDQLKLALAAFDRLGAAPMRARTVAALREAGAAVPRGRSGSASRNPAALTDRELQVLSLIGTGATDREIAARLGISARTVNHHVSRILGKLQVRTRAEAAVEAERMGLHDRGPE